ncbi:MAG: tryptophan-rich sensory protein [Rhizonema sp. NSF051]|nr:tryptophan-rich sensory protein [Rhizonema sp. NSF051]
MLKSWMVIGAVTLLIEFGSFFITPRDVKWFAKLTRPRWLVFEPLIPLIWTVVFVSGAASANIVWQKNPGSLTTWLLMSLYLLLEIVTISYIPLMLRLRSLNIGEIAGSVGVILGVILTLAVLPTSKIAALLLLPYLAWSPVGTYTTEELKELNPKDA